MGDVSTTGTLIQYAMLKKDSMPDIMSLVGYVVAALFVVFGLFIMFTPQIANSFSKEFRTIFGVTVIGYGIFRMVIIFQKSRRRKYSDDETDE
jgi:uncharacterized membrane protein HdeD (DUF308 family)